MLNICSRQIVDIVLYFQAQLTNIFFGKKSEFNSSKIINK